MAGVGKQDLGNHRASSYDSLAKYLTNKRIVWVKEKRPQWPMVPVDSVPGGEAGGDGQTAAGDETTQANAGEGFSDE